MYPLLSSGGDSVQQSTQQERAAWVEVFKQVPTGSNPVVDPKQQMHTSHMSHAVCMITWPYSQQVHGTVGLLLRCRCGVAQQIHTYIHACCVMMCSCMGLFLL